MFYYFIAIAQAAVAGTIIAYMMIPLLETNGAIMLGVGVFFALMSIITGMAQPRDRTDNPTASRNVPAVVEKPTDVEE